MRIEEPLKGETPDEAADYALNWLHYLVATREEYVPFADVERTVFSALEQDNWGYLAPGQAINIKAGACRKGLIAYGEHPPYTDHSSLYWLLHIPIMAEKGFMPCRALPSSIEKGYLVYTHKGVQIASIRTISVSTSFPLGETGTLYSVEDVEGEALRIGSNAYFYYMPSFEVP